MTKIRLVLETSGAEINSSTITGEASVLEDAFYAMSDVLNAATRPKDRSNNLASELGKMIKYGKEDTHFMDNTIPKKVEEAANMISDNMRKNRTGVSTEVQQYKENIATETLSNNMSEAASQYKKEQSNLIKEDKSKSSDKKILKRGKRALVAFRCPDCGELIIMIGEAGDEVKCRKCGSLSTIPEGLILTIANCPNCTNRVVFYSGEGVDMISCKNCESPIDVKYVDKLGHKISL